MKVFPLLRTSLTATTQYLKDTGHHVDDQTKARLFEEVCMPHLDVAHNLAYWLARDEGNAEDIVQEAYLRAYKFIGSFDGDSGRAWLLAIVRNTFYTWLEKNRSH